MADERLTQSRAQVQADLNKIEATPEFTSVGTGLAIASKVLSMNLTAGNNISISGNTISATDTTYTSKTAAEGGTEVSLVTTGEKYVWNNKSDFSGSYTDLTNKPDIPTVNNATLTIKAGGTSKGTFTANSATDVEVDITATDLGLSSALKFIGTAQSTPPSAGKYIKTTIDDITYYIPVTTSGTATQVNATKGDVIVVGTKEYVCVTAGAYGTNVFQEIGDESSYALKTVTISAGTGLTGGGTLEANRTLSLADNYGDTKNPYASKTANQVLAAPNGSNGAPSFRALAAADIPALDYVAKPNATLGSTTKPIYYNNTNGLQEGSTYAGGTKVTLNGSDKGASTATIYAPTAAPTTPAANTKGYLVGTSTTSTLSTEYTDSKVYMMNDKLYSNDTEVLTGNQTITLSGAVTGSGTTAITTTLANSGVTAGTYSSVTVNQKGLVTAGAQILTVIENGGSTDNIAVGGWYFEKNA